MAKYKTALGKTIDISVLASKNEKTRAVGNMAVNARGDSIDAQGRIITPVTEKVNQNYAKTVGNRSANPVKKIIPDPISQPKLEDLVELSQFEKELEETMTDDVAIEQLKEEELKTQQKKVKK
jgi:hypothetical protein